MLDLPFFTGNINCELVETQRGARSDAKAKALKDVDPREATLREGGRQSNHVYVQSIDTRSMRGESRVWREIVGDSKDVIALRRSKLGMIRGVKSAIARQTRGWETLDESKQEELLACPCGMILHYA